MRLSRPSNPNFGNQIKRVRMSRYKLRHPFSERECVPCALGGEVVDLTGKGYERVIPATLLHPEKRVKVRGATQKDLKRLYEAGGAAGLVEKVERVKEEKPEEGRTDVGND